MPVKLIPKSEITCSGCGAVTRRHMVARLGWARIEGPRRDALGRRDVSFRCPKCR